MSLGVPRRSKTKSKKPEENGVDSLMKGEVRTDPVDGLQQRETEDDQWRKFSITTLTVNFGPKTDSLKQEKLSTMKASGRNYMLEPVPWLNTVRFNDTAATPGYIRNTRLTETAEPRKFGPGVHNKTAFCETQRAWSLNRSEWPQIKDNILNRFERKGYATEQLLHPRPMMWGDRVVIDNDNQ